MIKMYKESGSHLLKNNVEKTIAVQAQPQEIVPQDEQVNKTYNEFIRENNKIGILRVQTSAAQQAVPISGAQISIKKVLKDGTKVFYRTTTNINGIVDGIKLRAPSKEYSLQPLSDVQPYASYEVVVNHPDFIQKENHNCQIFEDVKSVQLMNLIPTPAAIQKAEKGE